MPNPVLSDDFVVANLQTSFRADHQVVLGAAIVQSSTQDQARDAASAQGLASRTENVRGVSATIQQHPQLGVALILAFAVALLAVAAWSLYGAIGKRRRDGL